MSNLGESCLVMLAAPPFHGMKQRHQHVAERLSAYMPVVYVEGTPSAAAVFLRKIGDASDLSAHKKGLVQERENLWVYKAPPNSPTFFNFKKVNTTNMKKTAEALEPLLTAKGFTKRILWLGHPNAVEAAEFLKHDLMVYDCYDAFGEFEQEARNAEQTKTLEAAAFEKSDLVLTTARLLYKKHHEKNPRTYLVPNGAEISHFQQVDPPKPSKQWGGVDIDALAAKGKVVGFIGDIG